MPPPLCTLCAEKPAADVRVSALGPLCPDCLDLALTQNDRHRRERLAHVMRPRSTFFAGLTDSDLDAVDALLRRPAEPQPATP